MTGMRVRLRGEGGQATVELALVLPLLLAVVTGIVQFGIVYKDYINLVDAVRAGARVATVSRAASNPVSDTTNATQQAATGLKTTQLAVDVKVWKPDGTASQTWDPGDDVTVTATYPYSISIFGLPLYTGSLTSSTRQRIE